MNRDRLTAGLRAAVLIAGNDAEYRVLIRVDPSAAPPDCAALLGKAPAHALALADDLFAARASTEDLARLTHLSWVRYIELSQQTIRL